MTFLYLQRLPPPPSPAWLLAEAPEPQMARFLLASRLSWILSSDTELGQVVHPLHLRTFICKMGRNVRTK